MHKSIPLTSGWYVLNLYVHLCEGGRPIIPFLVVLTESTLHNAGSEDFTWSFNQCLLLDNER